MIKLEDRLYTSTEVADILGVSLRSVYRYIEENKLHAEVKTATGRHRFTKQDILNFLYPEGIDEDAKKEPAQPVKVSTEVSETPEEGVQEEQPQEQPKEEPKEEKEETAEEETKKEDSEESVDWLSKFREAAKKFQETEEAPKEESKEEQKEPESPKQEEDKSSVEGITGLGGEEQKEEPTPEPEEEEEEVEGPKYYKSGLGGLKDIAQGVDKTARNAQLPYSFTLSAGLSLHSPIKPFSLLHVYVRPDDLEFYEKSLKLSVSEENDAQLCLLVTKDNSVFADSEELHGLFVVGKDQLTSDIDSMGDQALKDEASSILE